MCLSNQLISNQYTIEKTILGDIDWNHMMFEEIDVDTLNKFVLSSSFYHKLKKGDVILFLDAPSAGYRNEGLVIWDGRSILHLESDEMIDDYGYLPSSMTINQFPKVDYFRDTIHHNCYVWFDPSNYTISQPKPVAVDEYYGQIYELEVIESPYKIYTINPAKFMSHEWVKSKPILLTYESEFGHEFNGPNSLYDDRSFQDCETHESDLKEKLAHKIINSIRDGVLKSIKNTEDPASHDPWTEAYDGVCWIDNEVDLFASLYTIYKPDEKQLNFHWDSLTTVEQAKNKLAEIASLGYMTMLYNYLSKGGTDGFGVFDLLD